VAKQSGYYGDPFEATRGVTQGDIISPMIFNIVVDAVVHYWLSLVVDDGSEFNGLGHTVSEWLVLFYADDGLLATRNHEWLQMAINRLSELFERVGLRTNTTKTVAMTCTPGYIHGRVASPVYKRRREGGGLSYQARQRQRVACSICGVDLSAGLLVSHMQTQHGVAAPDDIGHADAPGRAPAVYRVSFPRALRVRECPVEGCPGSAVSTSSLRRHFMHRHPSDTLVILEEGSVPLPRCEHCGMHVPAAALSSGHYQTAVCRAGAERARRRLALEDSRLAREVVFSVKGSQLASVSVFRYLGRELSSSDDDWPAVYRNVNKARQRWAHISRVLAREGANTRIAGMFYKAVVQSVLLYGCKMWVLTARVLRAVESFHNQVARQDFPLTVP
jgi:hypothetical protein